MIDYKNVLVSILAKGDIDRAVVWAHCIILFHIYLIFSLQQAVIFLNWKDVTRKVFNCIFSTYKEFQWIFILEVFWTGNFWGLHDSVDIIKYTNAHNKYICYLYPFHLVIFNNDKVFSIIKEHLFEISMHICKLHLGLNTYTFSVTWKS